MPSLFFDFAHLLASSLVLLSFMLLYQSRMIGVINVFTGHAVVLATSIAWQAYIQQAPHLYITAALALIFKAIIIPIALVRIVERLHIHRTIETAVGIGTTMLAGMLLVALSIVVMLPVTEASSALAREDMAFALSVVLLGLLNARRDMVLQIAADAVAQHLLIGVEPVDVACEFSHSVLPSRTGWYP